MPDFIHDLSKAELHVHLEGSIEPATLLEIAPALSIEEITARYRYDGFIEFLKAFGWVAMHLSTPRHYAIATRRLLARLAQQNVRYAEITLSAGVVLRKGQDLDAIHQAVREAASESPVRTAWIWDAVRQWGAEPARRVAEAAVSHREDGVVAFGLGGDEAGGQARDFGSVFRCAKDGGLHLVCHAGEVTDAESVWQALECGAERIGHGIRAIDDDALVRHLAEREIPLEVSISSNVCLRNVTSLEHHPVRRLYDAGVPIVLNTDDPPMFQSTLEGEYRIAADAFGFTEAELRAVARNGFQYAFAWQPDSKP
ncbi:MAG: adenosine deaminase [Acidobacteria bacterium]|nr:adenosine deaminase [Acidobacteriota bacterium]